MGRHSLPHKPARSTGRAGSPRHRRRIAIAVSLVLAVTAGAGIAVGSGLLSFTGPCERAPVRVDLVASPDIAPALSAVADRARRDQVTSDGRCLDVRVEARENYKVADMLAAGTTGSAVPDFQIWVPDSDVWVDRATTAGGVPLTPAGNVALSPVAVAAAPASAQALGWPRKTYTWAGLAAMATETDRLLLGAADPARSATGLLALGSISESSRQEAPKSDTRTAATAKLLTRHVSDTDAEMLRTLASDDGSGGGKGAPRPGEAMLLSEQAAYAHNSADDGSAHLSLFYPTDGAPALDYPYNLVDVTRLTTDQSRAAMRFMLLLSEKPSYRTLERYGFRAADAPDSPVPSALVRTAGGRSPQPFAESDISPPSSEAVQQALGLWTVTVQSARLTTVVDASASMTAPVPGRKGQSRMEVTKASLLEALATFTPEDEIGLWEFSTRLDGAKDYRKLTETLPLGSPVKGGTHRGRLSAAVTALKPIPDGDTGLYDTALAAYKEAQAGYVQGKFNAVVLLTDGSNRDDDGISRGELIKRLKELVDPGRPVPLIAIAVGPDADRREVDEIARAAEGAGYEVSDPADIRAVILRAIMAVGHLHES
ncbi:substrate-binding domain-containing protein [Streptomyces lushanensis]|uniref:substrate-binding domain-containing protein n=1 Tax=Streptomyces lushanensis TaxID=1434255 RepID=UPI0008307D6E|nr:substrate-binding domain-containing protein [Streptomyces lushanensis]